MKASTTLFSKMPIFSISIFTISSGWRNLGLGFCAKPTPAGVPVASKSQGSKVIIRLR